MGVEFGMALPSRCEGVWGRRVMRKSEPTHAKTTLSLFCQIHDVGSCPVAAASASGHRRAGDPQRWHR